MYKVQLTNSVSVSDPPDVEEQTNAGTVVGSVVGGVLAAVIVAALCIYNRRTNTSTRRPSGTAASE